MEVTVATWVALSLVFVSIIVRWAWSVLDWVWLKPKKLEICLRKQGLKGNSYRLLYGDMMEKYILHKQANSKPMNLSTSHDIAPRLIPLVEQTVKTYGKNSFVWNGPIPRVIIMNSEDLKDVFTKLDDFQKPKSNPLLKLLATGLATYEGDKWAKHRRIINPAFHLEKLKQMLPAFYISIDEMIKKWESLASKEGSSCELDIWPSLQNLTADVISRTAFGSTYQEGMKIFELLKEQEGYAIKSMQSVYILGWRFLPTKMNKRMKKIDKEIKGLLKELQDRARQEVLQVFGSNKPDFDGLPHLKVVTMILLEVLRLYPAVVMINRTTQKKTQLGRFSLPAGVQYGAPIILQKR
ncbi:hypothetical protein M0R45_014479 [Rubus argutus]|uniref:Cytochrome P450 CYP72A219-like n=1 Tax=Rubus argutus TaxID=59490 RepID=A0AAW1XLR2_RUBAR